MFYKEVRKHHLFSCLSEHAFQFISQYSGLISLKKNEILFESDQEANHFFLVRTGQVTLFQSSRDGNEKIVDIFDAGQSFAETTMFSDTQCYQVGARATCNSGIFFFHSEKFKSQMHLNSDSCFSMMTEMSKRLKSQTQEIIELSLYDAQYRLANYLLENSCEAESCHGCCTLCLPLIKLSTTKSLLASRLSITPETFSRILARLKKQGLISIKDDTIFLHDTAKLREMVGCYSSEQKKSGTKQGQKQRFIA